MPQGQGSKGARWGYALLLLCLACFWATSVSARLSEYEPSQGKPLAIQIGTTSRRAGVVTGEKLDVFESVPIHADDLALSVLLEKNETAYRDLPILPEKTKLSTSLAEWLLIPDIYASLAIPVAGHTRAVPVLDALSLTIRAIHTMAEDHLRQSFNTTLLSIPHRLGDDHRQLFLDAAASAGIEPLRVVHESIAAAIGQDIDHDLALVTVTLDGADLLSVELIQIDAGVYDLLGSASAVPYTSPADAVDIALESAKQLLDDHGLTAADITLLLPLGTSPDLAPVTAVLQSLLGLRAPSAPSPADAVIAGLARHTIAYLDDDPLGCPIVEIQPLTLSVETNGGLVTPLVTRFTILPARRSISVLPLHHGQTSMRVRVFLGERASAKDNMFVAELDIPIHPPALDWRAPVGEVQITLEVGTDRSLSVGLVDERTGWAMTETLAVLDGLDGLPLDDMIMAAETFEAQDAALRSLAGGVARVGGRFGEDWEE